MKFLNGLFFLSILSQAIARDKMGSAANFTMFDEGRTLDVGTLVTTLFGLVTAGKLTKAALAATAFLLKAKPVMIILGAIYMVTFLLGFLFPAAPALLGLRSLNDVARSMDFSKMSQYMTSWDLTERAFTYLDIKELVCKERAACEVGEYMAKRFSTIATAFRVFSDMMPASYTDALSQGTRGLDCGTLYRGCRDSPLERFG